MKKILILGLLLICNTSKGVIAITEFFANPASISDATGEYIELFNFGATTVNLQNWTLTDEDADTTMTLPSFELASGNYVLIVGTNDKDNIEDEWFGSAVKDNIIEVVNFGSLANGDDELALRDDSNVLEWRLAYNSGVTAGSSTYLSDDSRVVTDFGTKASPGIVIGGNDVTGAIPPVAGYELSVSGTHGAFESLGEDEGSPLTGHYSAVPEPHEYALVAGLGLLGFALFRHRRLRAHALLR